MNFMTNDIKYNFYELSIYFVKIALCVMAQFVKNYLKHLVLDI